MNTITICILCMLTPFGDSKRSSSRTAVHEHKSMYAFLPIYNMFGAGCYNISSLRSIYRNLSAVTIS